MAIPDTVRCEHCDFTHIDTEFDHKTLKVNFKLKLNPGGVRFRALRWPFCVSKFRLRQKASFPCVAFVARAGWFPVLRSVRA